MLVVWSDDDAPLKFHQRRWVRGEVHLRSLREEKRERWAPFYNLNSHNLIRNPNSFFLIYLFLIKWNNIKTKIWKQRNSLGLYIIAPHTPLEAHILLSFWHRKIWIQKIGRWVISLGIKRFT